MAFDKRPVRSVTHPQAKKGLFATVANLEISLGLLQLTLREFLTATKMAFSGLGFFLSFSSYVAKPHPFCAASALLIISALAPSPHAQSAANNAAAQKRSPPPRSQSEPAQMKFKIDTRRLLPRTTCTELRLYTARCPPYAGPRVINIPWQRAHPSE